MTKADLIRLMAKRHHLSERQAGRVVNDLLKTIQEEVLAPGGGTVSLAGFGAFKSRALRTHGRRTDGTLWTREPLVAVSFKPFAASGANTSTALRHVRAVTKVEQPASSPASATVLGPSVVAAV